MKNSLVYPKENPIVQNMELRDFFAAQAMVAILTDGSWHGHTCYTAAETAYEMADAMLEARK